MLVTLLLPAVQAARAAARRVQCINTMKQFGLAAMNHESAYGFLPSGGWGWGWVGDPDQGPGREQPGGWVFSLLPFYEEQGVYGIGAGMTAEQKRQENSRMFSTVIATMNCPSRRENRALSYSSSVCKRRAQWSMHEAGLRSQRGRSRLRGLRTWAGIC